MDNTLVEARQRDKVEPISLDWYWSQPEGDEILMKVRPVFPSDIKTKDIVLKDLREFVEDRIGDDLKKDYIRIKDVSKSKVVVAFDSTNWLRQNFLKDPKVKFHLPRTLEWKMKKRLPSTLMSHTSWNVVRGFIEDKFKSFIKEHNKTMFRKKMKLLKKVNYNWFDYEADLRNNKIFVRMKPRVMIMLGIAAYAAKKVVLG